MLSTSIDYAPITIDEAVGLVEQIVDYEWAEEQIFAFVRLLRGICAAHYGEQRDPTYKPGVEGIVLEATTHAYAYTMHHNHAFHEFATLNHNDPRDRKVVNLAYIKDRRREVGS